MLSVEEGEGWNNPQAQHFRPEPSSPTTLQAVSITRADIAIQPYVADSIYGLAFSIGNTSNFYQYFALDPYKLTPTQVAEFKTCSPQGSAIMKEYTPAHIEPQTNWAVKCNKIKALFCGRCVDGGACDGTGVKHTPNWLVLSQLVTQKNFLATVDDIVGNSGSTALCKSNFIPRPTPHWATTDNKWNEFDTGEFPPSALRGVLVNDTPFQPSNPNHPSDATV